MKSETGRSNARLLTTPAIKQVTTMQTLPYQPTKSIDRYSGEQELRDAQAHRCEHLADELSNDLGSQRDLLTANQIAEVTARIARLRGDAAEWRQ